MERADPPSTDWRLAIDSAIVKSRATEGEALTKDASRKKEEGRVADHGRGNDAGVTKGRERSQEGFIRKCVKADYAEATSRWKNAKKGYQG